MNVLLPDSPVPAQRQQLTISEWTASERPERTEDGLAPSRRPSIVVRVLVCVARVDARNVD